MRDLFFGFGEFVGLVDVFRVLISYLGLVFPDCTVMVWVLLGCFFYQNIIEEYIQVVDINIFILA
jgi:hypothetical protein